MVDFGELWLTIVFVHQWTLEDLLSPLAAKIMDMSLPPDLQVYSYVVNLAMLLASSKMQAHNFINQKNIGFPRR